MTLREVALHCALTHDHAMEPLPKSWWVYLLACRDGRTYTGVALDVDARFQLHRTGKGAKFTRANPPQKILGAQCFPSRSEAQKAEYALKQLERAQKLAWAKSCGWSRREEMNGRKKAQKTQK